MKLFNLTVTLAILGIDGMTIYTSRVVAAINDAEGTIGYATADASGGIENFVGAILVSLLTASVYLYQGIFAESEDN